MNYIEQYVKAEIPTRQYGNVEIGGRIVKSFEEGATPQETAVNIARASKLAEQMLMRQYLELREGIGKAAKSFTYIGGEVDGKTI